MPADGGLVTGDRRCPLPGANLGRYLHNQSFCLSQEATLWW
jgi:hypothetical protein